MLAFSAHCPERGPGLTIITCLYRNRVGRGGTVSSLQSADEVRSGFIHAMGRELGELFHAVSIELAWAHGLWRQYRTLFGDKPSRIDLLNEAAPFFFRIVQDVFFEGTLLAIARLVGSAESRNKQNLAVDRFRPHLTDLKLRDEIDQLIAKAKSAGEFAVDWRNRRIAHRDLGLSLGTAAKPLKAASREKIEQALSALRDVLNHIEEVYCNATTTYTHSVTLGDAETLLYVIRDGLLREQERRARLRRGERHEDDINPTEEV